MGVVKITIAKLLGVGLLGLVFLIGCGGGGGGASSSDGGGSNKPLTIEEAFPILNGGVKSGERSNSYRDISQAEIERFKNNIVARGFYLDNKFYYKKNIRYSTLGTYDATVSLGQASTGSRIAILWLENNNGDVDVGDVEKGAFDNIFGTVNGKFLSNRITRVFNGDKSLVFEDYAKKLEKEYNFTCRRDGEDISCSKRSGGFYYLWTSSPPKYSSNISVATWDIE